MPDDAPTEEQTHIQVILRRWKEFHNKCALLASPFHILTGIAVYYILTSGGSYRFQFTLFLLLFPGIVYIISQSFTEIASRRFVKKMTEAEGEMLVSAMKFPLTRRERASLKYLQTAYTKVNPKQEYLRASNEPQEDTLLRAAAHTDNTPQDQLLRPTDDNKPHPSNGKSH